MKIKIPFGENFIVTEAYKAEFDIPTEISTYIEDKNGVILQDLCMVRQHYSYEENAIKTDDSKVDCIVWADSESEDYTHKFVIDSHDFGQEEMNHD